VEVQVLLDDLVDQIVEADQFSCHLQGAFVEVGVGLIGLSLSTIVDPVLHLLQPVFELFVLLGDLLIQACKFLSELPDFVFVMLEVVDVLCN